MNTTTRIPTRRVAALALAALMPLTLLAPASASAYDGDDLVLRIAPVDSPTGAGSAFASATATPTTKGGKIWANTRNGEGGASASGGTAAPSGDGGGADGSAETPDAERGDSDSSGDGGSSSVPNSQPPYSIGGLTADVSTLIGDGSMYELSIDGSTFDDLENRYGSFTAGLINVQARTSGQKMDSFLASQQSELNRKLPELGRLRATNVGDLNSQLSLQGLSFSNGQDVLGLAQSIDAMPDSPDKAVAQAGANWAREIANVRMPKLTSPSVGPSPKMPDEALMFGLFANKSLTSMAVDHPDLFAQVERSGLTDPTAQDAWRQSMLTAHQTTSRSLSSALSDPCSAAYLTAMSTGSASAARESGGRDCGSCVASGLASSSHMSRLFDRGGNTTFYDPGDNTIYPQEWTAMQPWMRELMTSSGAGDQPRTSGAATSGGNCSSPSAGTDAARTVLPGVFSQLSQ